MIAAADLERRLAGLRAIGHGERGTTRLAWTAQDAAAGDWFREQAAAGGLRVERDPAGSLWALPDAPAPWWGAGSHLDSVRGGGSYDGALGVVAAFEVAARSRVPLAVVAFADEEGARYNTPTFGSRALVGRLDAEEALARVDDRGVALADAMAAAGVDPAGLARAPEWLARLRGFLELHIDQSRDLERAGAPAGVVSSLASRLRLRARILGGADHSGTTPRAERRDALAAAARLIVRSDELAASGEDLHVTTARILVEPNAATTIPASASLWIDARAARPEALETLRGRLAAAAAEIAEATGTSAELSVEALSRGITFDPAVREALAAACAALGDPAPSVVCFAGHDAGVLAERIPTGMVFVRNATGVSHSPEERVELEDAAYAAEAMLAALGALA